MTSSAEEEEYACELCNEVFETKRALARHTRLVASGTPCNLGW